MIQFQIPGARLKAELFVFDKDGLLFDSEIFWKELAVTRARNFARIISAHIPDSCLAGEDYTFQWLRAMGADLGPAEHKPGPDSPDSFSAGGFRIDHLGVMAAASSDEEITVTAGFLTEHLHLAWAEARDIAREIFGVSDRELDMTRALKPMEGFPDIFRRLRERQVPYGIATSDTYERAEASVRLYDDWEAVNFVITPKDVTKGKPDREMLDKISEITKIKTADMVMIGDSCLDVSMAKAAGAIGVGVTKDPDMKKRMREFTPWIVESLDQIGF